VGKEGEREGRREGGGGGDEIPEDLSLGLFEILDEENTLNVLLVDQSVMHHGVLVLQNLREGGEREGDEKEEEEEKEEEG